MGLGSVGCAGRGWVPLLLRRCDPESGRSPKGPRPGRWVSGRLGLRGRGHDSSSVRDSRTILPSCGPCLAKEEPWRRNDAPEGSDSPFSWTVTRKGRIPAHLTHLGPPRTQDSAFACRSPNDAAFTTGSDHECSILRPLTHERRILRHPEPRSESPPEPGPVRRSRPFRSAGPLAATATQQQAKTQPQRRSSKRRPSHSDAAASEDPATATQQQAKTQPQRRSSKRRPSHSDAAASGDPAEATHRRPTPTRRRTAEARRPGRPRRPRRPGPPGLMPQPSDLRSDAGRSPTW